MIQIARKNTVTICAPTGKEGLTLLEIMVAVAILAVGIIGTLSALLTTRTLNQMSKEYMIANHAMHSQIELARTAILTYCGQNDYDSIYNKFGSETAPVSFAVSGLRKASGQCFVIQNESSIWLGSPVDLDMNGDTASTTYNLNYTIFPVRVTVTWENIKGKVSQSMMTFIVPQEFKGK